MKLHQCGETEGERSPHPELTETGRKLPDSFSMLWRGRRRGSLDAYIKNIVKSILLNTL